MSGRSTAASYNERKLGRMSGLTACLLVYGAPVAGLLLWLAEKNDTLVRFAIWLASL